MTVFLFVRMALYFVFAWLAGFGFGELDPAGSYFTVSLDQATEIIVGVPPDQTERRRELQTLIAQNNANLQKLEANLGFLKKQETFPKCINCF